jgi:hypothetical protein
VWAPPGAEPRRAGDAPCQVSSLHDYAARHPSGAQFDMLPTDEDVMMLASCRSSTGGGGAQQQYHQLQQHELQAMAAEALYEEHGGGGLGGADDPVRKRAECADRALLGPVRERHECHTALQCTPAGLTCAGITATRVSPGRAVVPRGCRGP